MPLSRRLALLVLLAGCKSSGSDVKVPLVTITPPQPTTTTTETTDTQVWDARFDPFVNALLDDLQASSAAAVSAAIYQDGEVVFASAFGSAHPDRDRPVTRDTLFQIGSTTKMMTAAALLQKVQAGQARMDDPLSAHLPALDFARDPAWADQITLHHLVSHQGAFLDMVPWEQGPDDALLDRYTYDTFDDIIYLMAEPGSFWNYSNPNFSLAGLVTEVHDDRFWPDILVEDLLVPLSMDRTFLRKEQVQEDGDFALSYGYVDPLSRTELGTVKMSDVSDAGWVRPAGLAWSTPTQMVGFAAFLMHGDPAVLDPALAAQITTPHVGMLDGNGGQYGYGVMIMDGILKDETKIEARVWSHGGNTLSMSSELWMLPDHDFAISILSSGYGTDFSHSVHTALTTLPAGLPAAVPVERPEPDPERLSHHVGDYVDAYNLGSVSITEREGALYFHAPLLDELGYDVTRELVRATDDLYLLDIDGTYYDLAFVAPADDETETTRWVRNRAFVVTRVDEPETTALAPRHVDTTRDEMDALLFQARMGP